MRKTYDFNAEALPGGIVGRPRELAWPCKVVTIAKAVVKAGKLKDINPFERCILKLLALRCYSPRELAEETGLPLDLIAFILLRLYDRGVIDKDYRLDSAVRAELENHVADSSESEFEYHASYQFHDCLGGKKLKEINTILKAEEVDKNGSILKNSGSRPIRLHSLAGQERPSRESNAESCILRVRMVIQKSGDWRILNPFGNGWSPILEASYQQFLNKTPEEVEKFTRWQENNRRPGTREIKNRSQEPYDTEENRLRYPQLIAVLNRPQNLDEVDVYAALEWAFFYSLRAVDLKPILQLFAVDTIQNNEARLAEAASILGKNSDLKENHIFLPSQEKVKNFPNTEKAEMQVVLPLAILAAKTQQLPLSRVADKYKDADKNFLQRISALRDQRNPAMHGKLHGSAYGADDIEFMKHVIAVLLPTVHFSNFANEHIDEDTRFDVRFNARLELQNVFGVVQFNTMDSILQEYLIQAERFKQLHVDEKADDQLIDALTCMNNLYCAVECAIRPLIAENYETFPGFDAVAGKVRNAGLGELPNALKTVRRDSLRKTLDGKEQSLGASVVIWLLQEKTEDLQQIAIRMPLFLTKIGDLLERRRHGNQICMIRKSELNQICKSIYQVINIIINQVHIKED